MLVRRDFDFLRVKQIVREFQLMSSASGHAQSDYAAPVRHSMNVKPRDIFWHANGPRLVRKSVERRTFLFLR
jgi:hypothetical protein